MHLGGIFCDLAKAFDYVKHEILLVYLQFYGIRHVTEDYFRSYVRNRREKVEVTSPNATKLFFLCLQYIETWRSQGSILVSLLLIVYIDYLPQIINSISESVLFAADSS